MSTGEVIISNPDDPQPSRLRSWAMPPEYDVDDEYEALIARLALEQEQYKATRFFDVEAFDDWFEKYSDSLIPLSVRKLATTAIERML